VIARETGATKRSAKDQSFHAPEEAKLERTIICIGIKSSIFPSLNTES